MNRSLNNQKKVPPCYREPPDPSIPYIRVLPPYRDPPPPVLHTSKSACRFITSPEANIKHTSVRNLKVG